MSAMKFSLFSSLRRLIQLGLDIFLRELGGYYKSLWLMKLVPRELISIYLSVNYIKRLSFQRNASVISIATRRGGSWLNCPRSNYLDMKYRKPEINYLQSRENTGSIMFLSFYPCSSDISVTNPFYFCICSLKIILIHTQCQSKLHPNSCYQNCSDHIMNS